jgi:phosphatidate cytidylyltransferase
VGLILVALGGWPFALGITLVLCLAAAEYGSLARAGGIQASLHLLLGGVAMLALARQAWGFSGADWQIAGLTLAAMAYHLLMYERGRDQSGTDFAATVAGILYIGWLGAYFISLVNLPEGRFWLLTVLPAVWAADSGAYIVGTRLGRHKMTPRLSPKKSWEGFLGGIVFSVVITALLAYGWQQLGGPGSAITPLRGVILGLALSTLPTLGDLGESMLKRQVGVKDSGTLLPGHGGVFDRIDSWLWAAPVGYYVIVWFFLV